MRCNFGELYLGCNISLVYCIFGALHILVLCICTFGMLCIGIFGGASLVQLLLCNASFGVLFLGLGCSMFLVLLLWCYALSAISRRLATTVAHLLYVMATSFF